MATKLTLLSRDQILAASDIATEDVAVPEWGGTVRVRGLNAGERDELATIAVGTRGKDIDMSMDISNLRIRAVAMGVIDEDGDQVFSLDDVKALKQKSSAAIDRVADAVMRLSGMGETDVEELTKN